MNFHTDGSGQPDALDLGRDLQQQKCQREGLAVAQADLTRVREGVSLAAEEHAALDIFLGAADKGQVIALGDIRAVIVQQHRAGGKVVAVERQAAHQVLGLGQAGRVGLPHRDDLFGRGALAFPAQAQNDRSIALCVVVKEHKKLVAALLQRQGQRRGDRLVVVVGGHFGQLFAVQPEGRAAAGDKVKGHTARLGGVQLGVSPCAQAGRGLTVPGVGHADIVKRPVDGKGGSVIRAAHQPAGPGVQLRGPGSGLGAALGLELFLAGFILGGGVQLFVFGTVQGRGLGDDRRFGHAADQPAVHIPVKQGKMQFVCHTSASPLLKKVY